MHNKQITDICRRIFEGGEGASILVQPCEDGLLVGVSTSADKASKEYFGTIKYEFGPGMARAIGQAMIACADEIDAAAPNA